MIESLKVKHFYLFQYPRKVFVLINMEFVQNYGGFLVLFVLPSVIVICSFLWLDIISTEGEGPGMTSALWLIAFLT